MWHTWQIVRPDRVGTCRSFIPAQFEVYHLARLNESYVSQLAYELKDGAVITGCPISYINRTIAILHKGVFHWLGDVARL
jgi:hypothetical protein